MSASEMMVTKIERIDIDLRAHVAVLYLPEYCCTNMTGAIQAVTAMDPDCQMIVTIAGAGIDTRYERRGERWVAVDERGRRF